MPTFVHAADLHLDSPLRGLDRKEGAPALRIRAASRVALQRMVDAAIEREVSFVVLAGDLYDTQPAFETYLAFHAQMARLSRAGIPVAIVLGNHDHGGVAPRAERLPERVHVFPHERPGSLQIVPGAWVHGQSYPTRDVADDLTANYPAATPGALNIGLLHTALDGHSGDHARYAPSDTARLAAHGYAYWALGHVHSHLALHERGTHIVYPGNLQGRHARETGPKGAVFVDYDATGIRAVEHRDFDDVRWHCIEIDVASLPGEVLALHSVTTQVRQRTSACRAAGRLAAVRLVLRGRAPKELLALGEDEIRESLRAQFHADDDLFLERIELQCRPAAQDEHEVDHYLGKLRQQLSASPQLDAESSRADLHIERELRSAGGPELLEAYREALATQAKAHGPQAALDTALSLVREALMNANGD